MVFVNSTDNTNFMHYAKTQGMYANAASAWNYLEQLCQKELLFNQQKRIKTTIVKEQQRIKTEDEDFIAN